MTHYHFLYNLKVIVRHNGYSQCNITMQCWQINVVVVLLFLLFVCRYIFYYFYIFIVMKNFLNLTLFTIINDSIRYDT
jgi:hypothetical protein